MKITPQAVDERAKSLSGISLAYHRCYVIDGRLVHGLRCDCSERDNLLFVLNREGAQE